MRARGFTMMSMLFILVTLAALGAALAALSQRQQLGSAGELAAAKAYQAAFAGLEWGSHQVLRASGQPACPFTTRTFTLPDQLSDFTVTITCNRTPTSGTVTDDEQALAFYTLVATACNIPNAGCPNGGTTEPTYAERQLSRTLSK